MFATTDTTFSGAKTVHTRVGNRVYPKPANKNVETTRRFPVEVLREQERPGLPTSLADSLWERLEFSKFSATSLPDETPPLIKAYVSSLNQIAQFQRDVTDLIRRTCETNFEFRQETGETNAAARDEAHRRIIDEQMTRLSPWNLPPNILDAAVGSEKMATLYPQLDVAVRKALQEFTEQFESTLSELVDARIVGLIDWVASNACRYHFFTRVVLQANRGLRKTTTAELLDFTDEDVRAGRLIGRRRTREGESGSHTIRWGRHEHHVVDAFQTSIRNTNVIMPPAAGELTASIPDWLYDFVRVVDGSIVKQRVIECDYGEVAWDHTVVTRDEPIYGWEPAIIIDRFVLTGWGPAEVEAEQDRRATVENAERTEAVVRSATRERSVWLMGVLVTAFSATAIVISQPVETVLAPALCLWIAALLGTTQLIRAHRLAISRPASVGHYIVGNGITAGFLASGLMIGFWLEYGAMMDAATGVVVFVVSLLCLQLVRESSIPIHAPGTEGAAT